MQFDLISILINFLWDLGNIMAKYDCLWSNRVILRNVWTDSNFTWTWHNHYVSYILGHYWPAMNSSGLVNWFETMSISLSEHNMTRYDFLGPNRVLFRNGQIHTSVYLNKSMYTCTFNIINVISGNVYALHVDISGIYPVFALRCKCTNSSAPY